MSPAKWAGVSDNEAEKREGKLTVIHSGTKVIQPP